MDGQTIMQLGNHGTGPATKKVERQKGEQKYATEQAKRVQCYECESE